MRIPEHSVLFVDESGVAGDGSPGDPHAQYLCLLGCAVSLEVYWRELVPAIDELKRRHFPGHEPSQIALHRVDIVGKRGPFGVLRIPQCRSAFDADMLKLYGELPYILIGVVVDKVAHSRHPSRFYDNPYHWALALMLERYCGLLRVSQRIGRVVCEARGKHPDRLLQAAYQQVLEKGTPHHRHPAPFFHEVLSSKQIRFMPKLPAVAGLEISDCLVRAAKLEILADNHVIEPVTDSFAIAIEEAIGPKWNRRWGNKQVSGYGKAFFRLPY